MARCEGLPHGALFLFHDPNSLWSFSIFLHLEEEENETGKISDIESNG